MIKIGILNSWILIDAGNLISNHEYIINKK
jgi:hypothetical protein